jgi:hypothetical protein
MTFKDVTILQFQKLQSAFKHFDGNAYEVGMAILDIFEGVPKTLSSQCLVKDFDKRLAKYQFLIDAEMKDNEWVKEFELNGKVYQVTQQVHHWNVEQWVSMGTLTQDPDKIIENVHLILATLCTDERDIMDRANEFQNDLSIEVAYPIAVFFCAVMLKFHHDMPSYFQGEELVLGLA